MFFMRASERSERASERGVNLVSTSMNHFDGVPASERGVNLVSTSINHFDGVPVFVE
jgi:hypothetical protein